MKTRDADGVAGGAAGSVATRRPAASRGAWTLLVISSRTQCFFRIAKVFSPIIALTHPRKPVGCDPVVAKTVAVIFF
jgi:hypothetical protein